MGHGAAVPLGSVVLRCATGRAYASAVAMSLALMLIVCCARSHVAADSASSAPQVSAPGAWTCLFRDRLVTCASEELGTSVQTGVDSVPLPQFFEADVPCAFGETGLHCFDPPGGWLSIADIDGSYQIRQHDGMPLFLARDRIAVMARPSDASSVLTAAVPGLSDAVSWGLTVVAVARGRLGVLDLRSEPPMWESLGEVPANSRLSRLYSATVLLVPLVWSPGSTHLAWYRDGVRRPPADLEALTPPSIVATNSSGRAICTLDDAGAVACANDARLRCEDGEESAFHAVSLPGVATSLTVGSDHACVIVGQDVLCWGWMSPHHCVLTPVRIDFSLGRR